MIAGLAIFSSGFQSGNEVSIGELLFGYILIKTPDVVAP